MAGLLLLCACGGGGKTTPPPAPIITRFTAAKSVITSGTSTTLTAQFANGAAVVDRGVGPITNNEVKGTGNLSADTTFTLTLTGEGGTAIKAVTVSVVPAAAVPIITAPTALTAGTAGSASVPAQTGCTFAWTITGGTFSDGGTTAAGSNVTYTAGNTGPLHLDCTATNSIGDASGVGVVEVPIVAAPTITAFTAAKSLITTGTGTTLSASFTGGTGRVDNLGGISSDGTPLATGNQTADTTYTLTVTNALGYSVFRQVTVNVVAAPTITTFTAGKQNVTLDAASGTTLTAVFSNGVGSINHGRGRVQSGVAVPTGPLIATMLYTLTVTNAAGDSVSAGRVVYGPRLIATGERHAACVKADGTVWAWGDNSVGQLGDGTTSDRTEPVLVQGLSGVVSISAQRDRTLALKADGTVWAWGRDILGNGAYDGSSTPIQVTGLTDVVSIATGDSHGLALKSDGTVWAWGLNGFGELGDGTTTDRLTPVPLAGLGDVLAVDASRVNHALKADGTLWAWGYSKDILIPTRVPGVANAISMVMDSPPISIAQPPPGVPINRGSAILMSDGTVWVTWASGGQPPVQIPYLQNAVALAAGFEHTIVLKADGTVWGWGDCRWGQLGVTERSLRTTAPIQVDGLEGILSIAAGGSHTLALKADGTVLVLGDNQSGLLCDGSRLTQSAPAALAPSTWMKTMGGDGFSAALASDGTVQAWGDNWNGVLGDGSYLAHSLPMTLAGLSSVVDLAAKSAFSIALKSDGTVWAWGDNFSPMWWALLPFQVPGLEGVQAISQGGSHSVALKKDGTVWSWGMGLFGALGDGTETSSWSPVQAKGLADVLAISAGDMYCLALTSDHTVWAWGRNDSGQLGDGTTTTRLTPVQVQGLTGVQAIAAGSDHSLALKSDGTVWAWGNGNLWSGGLGGGGNASSTTPVQVVGLSGVHVVALAAGSHHNLVLDADGKVWAWGDNEQGQIGDGTYVSRPTPYQVPGLTGITAIGVGDWHSLAVSATHTYAWGSDHHGELGLGRLVWSATPRSVPSITLW